MNAPNRIPPYSEEAERGVLGSIILDPARVLKLCHVAGLKAASFYVPAHQTIFAAFASMDAQAIDLLTVGEHLKARGELDKIGGPQILERIVDATPTVAHAEHYICIVAEREKRRALIRDAQTAIDEAHGETPLENILASRTEFLRELSKDDAADALAPVDAGDWLDTEPPPVAPILHGLFEAGDKFELIGGSKTRKTFFMLQAALCLAAGRDFLGFKVDHPWRVLLIQMEVKPRHFHRRVFKLAAAMGLKRADLDGRLQIVNGRGLKLVGTQFFEHVRKLAVAHRAEIIVFDPLYKVTQGDENAAADIKPTLAEFDRLAEATGAAVGYVHHDSKGDAGERNIVDRGAGSGVLARDCDARIILTAHESEEDAFVVETVTRNFPPQDGFTIGWCDTETGYCFQTMPSVPALKRTRRSIQAGPKLATLVEQCADLIGAPMPKGDLLAKIRARTGAGRDKALTILKGLEIRPGVVCRQAKAKGAQWYIGEEKQMELLPGEGRK
jgi:replicative DNA helicase